LSIGVLLQKGRITLSVVEEPVTFTGEKVFLGGLVPTRLKDEFVAIAERNDRSQGAELRRMLRAYVAAEQTKLEERA
jgi:hypothetical protein